MALTPGSRIGAFEIAEQIGVGGMGEVYRATDTHLKRAVAIKVLPQALAADREHAARFQREAEVLAALNHPNVAFERAHALAPWFAVATGWLAAAHRLTGRAGRADTLLDMLGPDSRPLWGASCIICSCRNWTRPPTGTSG